MEEQRDDLAGESNCYPLTGHALATTLGDPGGVLVPKVGALLPGILARFGVVAAVATAETHPYVLSLLREGGATVATTEADVDLAGRSRREALRMTLEHGGCPRVVYMDLDHLLRWIENDAAELDRVLAETARHDCAVIGRGPRSFASLPERLARTEGIVNEIFRLTTGRAWDVTMAARSFSRRAAGTIVEGCGVDTIGNDCAWPLFCEAGGLSVGYAEAEGLTYRTDADYASGAEDDLDGDPRAWAERVLLAARHAEAMLPYIEVQRRGE